MKMGRLELKGLTNVDTVISADSPRACVSNEGLVSSSGTAGLCGTFRIGSFWKAVT